jgi:hypothetical protein
LWSKDDAPTAERRMSMADKKLSDNDIIKALERCFDGCNHLCPLYDYKDCKYRLLTGSLDLMNRQKAEIKEWRRVVDTWVELHEKDKAEIERLETEISKQYEQAKADILGNMADGGTSCHWCIEEHRNRAIKEFAEMLIEEKSYPHPNELNTRIVYVSDIQEMVCDNNAN